MIDGKLNEIRRGLLDMTRNNPLLNHRSRGARTLAIFDELPAEVFRILVEEDQAMQFLAREEAPREIADQLPPETDGKEKLPLENEDPAGAGDEKTDPPAPAPTPMAAPAPPPLPLAPIAREPQIADRHKDKNLQTLLSADHLQTRLVFLARQANSAIDEQGCNILYITLGLIEWCEAAESSIVSRAPLVFVPVELRRKNVNSRYAVHVFDDDIVANESLIQLCRSQFNFDFPAFDSEKDELEEYFARATSAIAGMKDWKFIPEINLGLFSFSKLRMYDDLDTTRWPDPGKLISHPLIRFLTGLGPADEKSPQASNGDGIPKAEDLDHLIEPKDCFQIVDADSSQQAAILAAKRGLSMVIEGPPGTGKSQTITNIISECLAEGKTVLFVSQKSAALDVVKRRLEQRDMGDFVLELHSRQASRKTVLTEINRVYEKQSTARRVLPQTAEELVKVRENLNEYHRQLHTPLGAMDISPFAAMSRAIGLSNETETDCDIPDVLNWTASQFAETQLRLQNLDRRLGRVGDAQKHPWRGVGLESAGLKEKQRIARSCDELKTAIDKFLAAAAQLAAQLSLPAPGQINAAAEQRTTATFLLAAPPHLAPAAAEARWNSLAPELNLWFTNGEARQQLRKTWQEKLKPSVADQDWTAVLSRRVAHGHSPLRFLYPSWRNDNRSLRAVFIDAKLPPVEKQIELLSAVIRSLEMAKKLQAESPQFAGLFGPVFKGIDGDWPALRAFAATAVALRQLVLTGRITADVATRILQSSDRNALAGALASARSSADMLDKSWQEWLAAIAGNEKTWLGDWSTSPLVPVAARLAELRTKMELLDDFLDLRQALRECSNTPCGKFVDWALTEKGLAARGHLPETFARHFYRLWMEESLSQCPRLRGFRGQDHNALIKRFRELDEQWIDSTRHRLAERLAARRPELNLAASRQSKLGLLQTEVRKKTRHMPLRKLLAEVGEVVQLIKPCFMMSPLSIAQYLAPGGLEFDVVIFDEASQVEPADAYGAIARGRQLLLVGDEKQLPPTDFFRRADPDETDREGSTEFRADDLESILSVGIARRLTPCGLRWHYRSRHSSLIEFSNLKFYDGQLRVFPSPHTDRSEVGLAFVHVESAVYLRGAGRSNPIEAAAVAAAAIQHMIQRPHLSLGVGTLNFPQQKAIEDEIERLRRTNPDPKIDSFYADHDTRGEPVFVKNLENIQGDERDVILLSIGFGKDSNGRLTNNFGALNDEGGWRRLNVLITRARERCVVFSSIRHDDIDLGNTQARGIVALKEYLNYAEHGHVQDLAAPGQEHDSEFEATVCAAIRRMGWEVHAQVGCAGFSIDLAVVDPRAPGRYLLGIECDGATYHSSPTARDRDRLRQEVLENLKWKIHRIWSTDWFHRPGAELERLQAHLLDLKSKPPEDDAPAPRRIVPMAPIDPVSTEKSPPPAEKKKPPDVAIYEHHREHIGGTIFEVRADRMREIVGELVAFEGPIHVEEATRAVAEMFGVKATARVREVVDRALVDQPAVARKGNFLWPVDMKAPPVRFRGGDCPVTQPELICPEEFEAAILLAVREQFGLKFDAVVEESVRKMGFARTGAKLKSAMEQALIRLDQTGRLQQDAAGFVTIPRHDADHKS